MVIKKVIDGIEKEIELTKEEMIDIACELDTINTMESVEDYIDDVIIEDYDENIQSGIMKFLSFNDEDKTKFYRYCAEGILNEMDNQDMCISDDLTDIFDDIIIESFEEIDEFIESEEIKID